MYHLLSSHYIEVNIRGIPHILISKNTLSESNLFSDEKKLLRLSKVLKVTKPGNDRPMS